jgi:hypothetical protein
MHRIQVGDQMVLYAVGGSKRIFALAEVTRAVYPSGLQDWPYRVDLNYEVNLPISAGVPLADINTGKRDLLRPIQRGASYVELRQEEFERAADKLQTARAATQQPAQTAVSSDAGDSRSSSE